MQFDFKYITTQYNIFILFNWKLFFNNLLSSYYFELFMFICALIALFLIDIVTAIGVPKSQDNIYSSIILTIFIIFAIEFSLNCIYIDNYFGSFFCLLDFISFLFLIPDISFIWLNMTNSNIEVSASTSHQQLAIFRTSRIGRSGAQIGRALRIIRLTRIFRFFKTWISEDERREKPEVVARPSSNSLSGALHIDNEANIGEEDGRNIDNNSLKEYNQDEIMSKSKVGNRYSEITAYRMILIVLLLVFIIPLLTATTASYSEQYGLNYLCELSSLSDVNSKFFNSSVTLYAYGQYLVGFPLGSTTSSGSASFSTTTVAQDITTSSSSEFIGTWNLIAISVTGTNINYLRSYDDLKNYRLADVRFYEIVVGGHDCIAIFSDKTSSQLLGLFSLFITVIALLVLVIGTVSFTREANNLVVFPVVRMLNVIYRLQKQSVNVFQLLGVLHTRTKRIFASEESFSPTATFRRNTLSVENIASLKPATTALALSSIKRNSEIIDYGRAGSINGYDSSLSTQSVPEFRFQDITCTYLITRFNGWIVKRLFEQDDIESLSETYILEQTFEKLSNLIQVLFGDYGLSLISSWVDDFGSLLIDKKPKEQLAIIVSCKIRNFEEILANVNEKSNLVYNSICDLVHTIVIESGGIINQSSQNGFIFIWKLPEALTLSDIEFLKNNEIGYYANEGYLYHPDTEESKIEFYTQANLIADNAMNACLKFLTRTLNSIPLQSVCQHSQIVNKYTKFQMLSLGIGCHVGTIYEGVIGTPNNLEMKIISPSLLITNRLADLTKYYTLSSIFTEEFISLLSPFFKHRSRIIDFISVISEGWEESQIVKCPDIHLKIFNPLKIYTYDFILPEIELSKNIVMAMQPQSAYLKLTNYERRKALNLTSLTLDELEEGAIAFDDEELLEMQDYTLNEFYELYHLGFSNYLNADWKASYYYFKLALLENPNDGPTIILLKYLEAHNFIAPTKFYGHRSLILRNRA